MNQKNLALMGATLCGLFGAIHPACAQGTAFTYQGRLNDNGSPANGTYGLTFALFNADTGAGQVGNTLTNSALPVSNGFFAITLDFGASFPGADRWLEIGVRTNGGGAFTVLSPRQKLTPTPYAITAGNVIPGAGLSGNYSGAVTLGNSSNSFGGTFTGNGVGMTNLSTTSSTFRILSLTPPAQNDTNWFGPWTPGTVTSGIQEAINSLPQSPNSQTPGGGTVWFGPGTFYTATNVYTPCNSNPFTLSLIGSGMNAGGMVYTGTVPQTVLTIGAPHSRVSAIFSMRNLYLASAINACTNILHLNGASTLLGDAELGGVARADISFCWIGYWPSMTNNTCGGFTPSSCADGLKHNLIGINAEGNFSDMINIDSCQFTYCLGIFWANDHGVVQNNMFEHCGRTTPSLQNDWPLSSPLYVGAAITCGEPNNGATTWNGNKHWSFKNNSFVGCHVAYYAGPAFASFPVSYDDQLESGEVMVVTPGTRWLLVNPRSSAGWAYPVNYFATNTANFSTWKNNPAPTNMVQLVDLRSNWFNGPITSTAGFSGNGSGLTNLILLAHSNSASSIPALSNGDNYYWSSNGVGYIIAKSQTGTLTTNKLW